MSATDSPYSSGVYTDVQHTCSSSIDASVTDLEYWITIDRGVRDALPGRVPVGLLLHGYTGNNDSFLDVTRLTAARALGCVLTPGGRGNNGATGTRDANARSPQDLADVIADARSRYPSILSPDVCVAYGAYSGGGGDLAALILKCPGLVSAGTMYFPLLNYERWYTYDTLQAPDLLDVDIGGDAATWPLRYLARYFGKWLPFALASMGASAPTLRLAWDDGDLVLDPQTQRDFVAACAALGVTIAYTESTDGTLAHGYPANVAGLVAHEIVYAADLRAATAITMPTSGSLPILGWIAWGDLSIWIGSSTTPRESDGGDRVGLLAFDTDARVYRISPITGPMYVSLRDGADTIAWLCERPCIVDVAAGTVTEIDDAPAGPLLTGTAPLLAGTAPLLAAGAPLLATTDTRTRTVIS